METDIAQTIYQKVQILPTAQQKEVLEIVEKKLSISKNENTRPIWEIAKEIGESITLEEWEKLPSDGSVNHAHYLYGAPKKY